MRLRLPTPLLLIAVLSLSCQSKKSPLLPLPAKLRQALTMVSDLQAEAFCVPVAGTPSAGTALTASSDGVSFSTLLETAAGDYTVEVSFRGRYGGASESVFLGRLVSDLLTVAEGDTVNAVFSKPLDTIGRPEDAGDEDGDGLGLLDELLWGTDPADRDSDDDGLADGADCFPTDEARAVAIASSGSIEDCDGDARRRTDLPHDGVGDDCDDLDPEIRECPMQDVTPPIVTVLAPLARAGCYDRFRVRLEDEAGVADASVSITTLQETMVLTPAGTAGEYVSGTLETGIQSYLINGTIDYVIEATDGVGNEGSAQGSFEAFAEVPTVEISPLQVGQQDTTFDLSVTASARAGVARIQLFRAPWDGGFIDRAGEVMVAESSASPAVFSVDPSSIPDGDYALYAVVEDEVGNDAKPSDTFSADAGPNGFATDADYLCIFDSGEGNIPIRFLSVGDPDPQFAPAKMRDHLQEAIDAAAAIDPAAQLTEVRGFGIQPDGFIGLDDAVNGSGKWWRYEFLNAGARRHIEVTWFSAERGVQNPQVDVTEDYAFTPDPIVSPSTMVDSDRAAQGFAAAGCPALTGHESDDIRYVSDEPFTPNDVIRLTSDTDDTITWKALASEPLTEIWSCQ